MAKDHQILRETLNKILDDNPLDIGSKYYILKDLFRDVEASYYTQINKELQENEEVNQDAESI